MFRCMCFCVGVYVCPLLLTISKKFISNMYIQFVCYRTRYIHANNIQNIFLLEVDLDTHTIYIVYTNGLQPFYTVHYYIMRRVILLILCLCAIWHMWIHEYDLLISVCVCVCMRCICTQYNIKMPVEPASSGDRCRIDVFASFFFCSLLMQHHLVRKSDTNKTNVSDPFADFRKRVKR